MKITTYCIRIMVLCGVLVYQAGIAFAGVSDPVIDRLRQVSATAQNRGYVFAVNNFVTTAGAHPGAQAVCNNGQPGSQAGGSIVVIDLSTDAGKELQRVAVAALLSGRTVRMYVNQTTCVNLNSSGTASWAPTLERIDLM